MTRWIGFGNISIYHVHPLLASAFYLIRSYAFIELKANFGKWNAHHPIFLTLIMFLGESLVGLIDLFETRRNSRKTLHMHKQTIKCSTAKMSKVILNSTKQNVRNLMTIAGIAIVEFSAFFGLQYVLVYIGDGSDLQTQIRSFKLAFDSCFCYLFLRYQIHRQHYASICLLMIGIVLVTVQELIKGTFDNILIAIFLSHSLVLSIRDCWEKWVMENRFINAIRLLFLRGVIGSVLAFILGVIFIFSLKSSLSIFDSFALVFSSNAATIIWFIVYLLCTTFYNLFYSLTKQYFSPTHMCVSDSFSTVMWMIILQLIPNTIHKEVNWGLLVIGYALVIFGGLVYNDIIILYFCGFDQNTKLEVSKRGIRENSFGDLDMIDLTPFDTKDDLNWPQNS